MPDNQYDNAIMREAFAKRMREIAADPETIAKIREIQRNAGIAEQEWRDASGFSGPSLFIRGMPAVQYAMRYR
jgi:hypothetical protein